jgi:hypothetical protein
MVNPPHVLQQRLKEGDGRNGHSYERSSGASLTFFHPARLRLKRRSSSSSEFISMAQSSLALTSEVEGKGQGPSVSTKQTGFWTSAPHFWDNGQENQGALPSLVQLGLISERPAPLGNEQEIQYVLAVHRRTRFRFLRPSQSGGGHSLFQIHKTGAQRTSRRDHSVQPCSLPCSLPSQPPLLDRQTAVCRVSRLLPSSEPLADKLAAKPALESTI